MKNLENYGVQELNAKEIRETEGGAILGLMLAMGLGYLVGRWIVGKL